MSYLSTDPHGRTPTNLEKNPPGGRGICEDYVSGLRLTLE